MIGAVSVSVVRGLDQWFEAASVRAEVYIGEQGYGFADEFDGADLAGATHLIAHLNGEPVGACRVRWFAHFAKLERVAVKRTCRSGQVPRALWRAVANLAARKGYNLVLGHIERSLLPFWRRAAGFQMRDGRPTYTMNGREFCEAIARLPAHPQAVSLDTRPDVLLGSDASLCVVEQPANLQRAS